MRSQFTLADLLQQAAVRCCIRGCIAGLQCTRSSVLLLLRAGKRTHHVLEIQLRLGFLPFQCELTALGLLGLGGGGERLEVWLRLGESLLLDHIRAQQVFEV